MDDGDGEPILLEALRHEPAPALILLDGNCALEVTRELAGNHTRPRADVHRELACWYLQREIERGLRGVREPVALGGERGQREGRDRLLPRHAAINFPNESADLVG